MAGVARPRVLVVNDDIRLAESARLLLVEEGYEARTAPDGQAAIETLVDWPADVVLLDLLMPRLDGWGFLERPALDPSLARAPVLVWSVALPEELERARRLGADGCLSGEGAPDPECLLAAVSRLLDARDS